MPKGTKVHKWPNGRAGLWDNRQHPMLGRKHSEETKRLISEVQKERFARNPELRPIKERHPLWNGGKTMHRGYVYLRSPDGSRYGLEHRSVMEKHIGRKLLRNEHVHHKDGDRTNNVISNLEIMESNKHHSMHMRKRWEIKKNAQVIESP